jgi:diadenosine tetraphosphate (Ap4A) HIT family hydrolase
VPDTAAPLPDFTRWPSFPFEGNFRVKKLEEPVAVEPPRKGEDAADCTACAAPDDAYIWVSDRWRVRAMDRPTGLPMVLILESRSHLDLGDLPNMLAAELGVMTVRLERAVRSLDDVARVHVNRWGDGEAHLHLWFMGRPQGRLQLRGTFLSLWDEILPPVSEATWRENLALVAAWLAEFGGTPLAEPPRIDWKAPAKLDSTIATLAIPDESDEADQPEERFDSAEQAEPAKEAATDPTLAADEEPANDPAEETAMSPSSEPVLERVPQPVPDASASSR